MNRLAINTLGDELEASADFCRSEDIGIEVTDFAFPWILNEDLTPRITRHIKAVEGITPLISHGPFFDLVATSPDSKIIAVTKQRHNKALEATVKIGASTYVAHAGFMPLFMWLMLVSCPYFGIHHTGKNGIRECWISGYLSQMKPERPT
jgi:hypothetical protein